MTKDEKNQPQKPQPEKPQPEKRNIPDRPSPGPHKTTDSPIHEHVEPEKPWPRK